MKNMESNHTEKLSPETKDSLLKWCIIALEDSINSENFEYSSSIFKLINAIKNDDDKKIKKYFDILSEQYP